MKLFQQLLVVPAALGLMAPVAATAAELNINDVSEYSNPSEVQSINQFSEVYPTDWAYQSLTNLAERHGCVASIPNGSMTRYEAAALLNKCLGNVAQVNEEERRLLNEFGPELAVIKGRLAIEGIEAGVDHSGHGHGGVGFSPTTQIHAKSIFLLGGVDSGETDEAVTFTYHNIFEAETSFNGRDLLLTEVEACNSGDTPFTGAAALESACDDGDTLTLARSFYQFPVRENWTATIGAKVRQDQMLGVWPSAYPSDTVLDVLTYAGANDAYAFAVGAGAGVTYAKDKFSTSLLFVSEEASNASNATNVGGGGGLLTAQGSDDVTGQIAWVDDRFTLAAVYNVSDGGNTLGTANAEDFTAWGLSGVYNIDSDSQFLPTSVSYGMGWKTPDREDNPDTASNSIENSKTWTLGLMWNDAFIDGNNLGFGIGTAESHREDSGYDDPLAYEVFYKMAVSDNITVTPALFVIQRDGKQNDDYTGAVVKTTFSF